MELAESGLTQLKGTGGKENRADPVYLCRMYTNTVSPRYRRGDV